MLVIIMAVEHCAGFTNKCHIVRAALEAICFQSREVLDAMRKDANLDGIKLLKVDGGATKNDLLLQIQVFLILRGFGIDFSGASLLCIIHASWIAF